jgi:cytochrome c peroxidase
VDRFRSGEVAALSADARQGLWLFESRGGCWRCHAENNFTDGRFHNTGVGWGTESADPGRYAITRQDRDRGAFKTPTLRNVASTGPYMHDGSLDTLEDVVRYYSRGGNPNPNLDPVLKTLNLSEADVRHLVAFLEALTGR